MAKFLATIKAVITRLVFAAHGFIAIWQVTIFKKNTFYWYLSSPILLLFFEGIFTLTIKESQEWKWFCPSVFLYLASIVPAIWLLELDKVDRRLKIREETFNLTASASGNLKELHNLIGVQIKLPELNLSTETWITLIEQFLMLILIIGRWMLPKGDLTRDQLSQLLLVYIGTAADIIEFFDSFKDDKIAGEPILVLLTLGIWSWSLMQFTVVLTATKSRKSRMTSSGTVLKSKNTCCNIDVWGIILNITLQDAPFLAFRLLIITHFKIISYMNVFFTCKNTLVILLQLYRLYVVYSENRKRHKTQKNDFELTNISIISKSSMEEKKRHPSRRIKEKKHRNKRHVSDKSGKNIKSFIHDSDINLSEIDEFSESEKRSRKIRRLQNTRKDTGYSTGSSHTSTRNKSFKPKRHSENFDEETPKIKSKELKMPHSKQKLKRISQKVVEETDAVVSEESEDDTDYTMEDETPKKVPIKDMKKYGRDTTLSVSSSDASAE